MLPQGSTISDVRHTLAQPERYVRVVLSNIVGAEREHGPVVVRIGVTGTGQFPHYRLDKRERRELLGSELTAYLPLQAFNGRNHQPLAREEIMTLLGQLRQRGGPRT